MMFWIIAIVLVIIVMMAVYIPLGRAARTDTTKPALMRALAAELAEVNADKGARFATPEEAEAARAEIGRRLLALGGATDESLSETSLPQKARSPSIFALFALVPILAVPLYLQLGQPEYADQSLAARQNTAGDDGQQNITQLVERVEKRLRDTPDDGAGWAALAPVYFRMGRIDDSFDAFGKAIEFHKGSEQEKTKLMADRAEVMVARADGTVTADAVAAFNQILTRDANNQKALFYLAMQLEQSGKRDEARANWTALIERFKAANPVWLSVAEQRLAGLNAPVPESGGPTAEEVEAASEMTESQRQDMIKSMVEGLAARLKDDPQDQFGWIKLIRARLVMNDRAQAVLDLEKARTVFAEGTQGRAEIDAVAQSIGL
jgi:cytochrome c-type biogenesis protein CcmH